MLRAEPVLDDFDHLIKLACKQCGGDIPRDDLRNGKFARKTRVAKVVRYLQDSNPECMYTVQRAILAMS